ncbi:MAG: ArsR family transcriptional regulator [Thermoproteota archaeon]
MDWAKYGYVIASNYRKKVVLSLAKGPMTPKQISMDSKLYLSHVSRILNELLMKKIIECLTPDLKRGKIFALTRDGKEIADQLERLR